MESESRDTERLPYPLSDSLAQISAALDESGIDWLLTGSAMRALRGFAVTPADLDVEVSGGDSAVAALALGIPAPGVDAGGRVRSLRSGGRSGGVELDLTADLVVDGEHGRLDPDFVGQRKSATATEFRGVQLWLAPIEEALARADALGDHERRLRILTGAPPGFAVDEEWVRRRLASVT